MSEQPTFNQDPVVYDHEDIPDVDLNLLTASKELYPDPRLQLLFEPPIVAEPDFVTEETAETSFAGIWERGLDDNSSLDVVAPQVKNEVPRKATEAQQHQSFQRLIKAKSEDPVIKAIVDRYSESLEAPIDIVEGIRSSAALRYELGSYFLRDKLEYIAAHQPHELPARVYANKNKTPHYPGYEHIPDLKSREYSAILALSMLDGTYADPEGRDVTIDDTGLVLTGQHRAAAEILLTGYKEEVKQQ